VNECCSKYGWCGKSDEYCKKVRPIKQALLLRKRTIPLNNQVLRRQKIQFLL